MRYLKVTGWGPFRLPGEKRRAEQAYEQAGETMEILRNLPDEQLYPELEEDDDVSS